MQSLYTKEQICAALVQGVEKSVRIPYPDPERVTYIRQAFDKALRMARRSNIPFVEIPLTPKKTRFQYPQDSVVEIFNNLAQLETSLGKKAKQVSKKAGINARSLMVAESFL